MEERILIVGAGPVGLSLAIALARAGLQVDIFELGTGVAPEVRGSAFHPAAMEKMDEWGVIDSMLERGYRVDRLQFWDRTERRLVGDLDYQLIAGDTSFPFRLLCPQHVYVSTLLAELKRQPKVRIYFEHEFAGSREDEYGIEARFNTPDGLHFVRGRWLCGADGANSAVRRSHHLAFEGMAYEERFLLVGTDLDLQRHYPGIGAVAHIADLEERITTLRLQGLLRIAFQLKEGEHADAQLDTGLIQGRVWEFLGEKRSFPILHRSIYRVHQRVAETFRVGRTFLLGDAAHINNPASGMGMNSGILDAACLGEKMSASIAADDEAPLDHYSSLRREDAINMIRQYTKQRHQDMSCMGAEARRARNAAYEAMSQDPREARAFLLRTAMLEDRM